MEWIAKANNQLADCVSRFQVYGDWMIDPNLFMLIDAVWGPHTVDCFASECNHQVVRFHSRFWCPDKEAVDIF